MELKQRIVLEASELFLKQGVRNVTMNDLAKHLGISKRTIYEQLSDKNELVALCIESLGAKSEKAIDVVIANSSDVIEVLKNMLEYSIAFSISSAGRFAEEVKKYYPQVFLGIVGKYHQKSIDRFSLLLVKGVEQNIFKPIKDPHVIGLVISELSTMIHKSDSISKILTPELTKWLTLSFIRGLCTQDGVKRIDDLISFD